jgi:hypothetical protein
MAFLLIFIIAILLVVVVALLTRRHRKSPLDSKDQAREIQTDQVVGVWSPDENHIGTDISVSSSGGHSGSLQIEDVPKREAIAIANEEVQGTTCKGEVILPDLQSHSSEPEVNEFNQLTSKTTIQNPDNNVRSQEESNKESEESGLQKNHAKGEQIINATQPEGSIIDGPGLPNAPIGYYPQYGPDSVPLTDHYPVVELPVAASVAIGTRIGRPGPRGVSERNFYNVLKAHFGRKILIEHRVELHGARHDYEPDIILHIPEKNLRIDIEVDEPYSGVSRKPMHWMGSYDDDRDVFFSNNGWIVVRFAEEQVVKQPESCAAFLAGIIDTLLNSQLRASIGDRPSLTPVGRWSREEAIEMANANYREGYLCIEFATNVDEELYEEIEYEKGVVRDNNRDVNAELISRNTGLTELLDIHIQLLNDINECIGTELYILFRTQGRIKLLKPKNIKYQRARIYVEGYEEIDQREDKVEIRQIEKGWAQVSDVMERAGTCHDIDKLKIDFGYAIEHQRIVQISYTSFGNESTMRSLSMIQPIERTGEEYIRAYCHLRSAGRTFRLDRIQSYRVLALQRPWEVVEGSDNQRIIAPLEW